MLMSGRSKHRVLADAADRLAEARRLSRDEDACARIAETFRALAEPSRVRIVDALLHQELCTSDLAEIIGLSEPAVSQHLRTLRMLRVVRSHRHGHRVFYALDDDHVRRLLTLTAEHLEHGGTRAIDAAAG
ncbi:MAG: helix-turn-helix transcriptional regulator [SAR202 cluster bacterium]|nr:helix-turn-helix transcriptional regulator [SAR202 cluster bacterium]